MKVFFNVLAALCAGLAVYGVWIMWAILHSPGDDNPFAIVGSFFVVVGLLFAWVASQLSRRSAGE